MTQPSIVTLGGSVSGALLATLDFRSANLKERLGQPSSAEIILESADPGLLESEFLGKSIGLGWDTSKGSRYFHGEIIQFAREHDQGGSTSAYRLEVVSWNALLENTSDFRIYQGKSVVDIVTDVFSRHEKGSAHFQLSGLGVSYPVLEYCVQYGESDFDFVQRLLQREGIYYYVRHELNSHCLVLCDGPGAHGAFPGYADVQFSLSSGEKLVTGQERISALSFQSSVCTPKHVSRDYNFKTPADSLEANYSDKAKDWNSSFEQFSHPGHYQEPSVGSHYVRVRQEAAVCREKVFSGSANARGVAVGHLMTAIDHDIATLSETMLVTTTSTRIYEPRKEASGQQAASTFNCTFTAIPAKTVFRPQRSVSWPRVNGHETAQVVGPEGEEVHVDEFGRIRVRFFWDRHIEKMAEASCWIRVAQPWAGNGWGFWSVPRIGQEVVVAFEGGDPDRPMVIGSVYNNNQKVPYSLPSQKNVSGWRSQSTKGGTPTQFNELRFDDTQGKEYVWFQAQRDFNHWVKRESKAEVGSHKHVLIHGNYTMQCKSDVDQKIDGHLTERVDGKWSVSVGDDINLQTSGQMGIEVASDLSMKTDAQASLKASTSAHLEAGISMVLGAGKSITLKAGPSSIVLGPSGVHISGPVVAINSGGGGSGPSPKAPEIPDTVEAVVPPKDPLG